MCSQILGFNLFTFLVIFFAFTILYIIWKIQIIHYDIQKIKSENQFSIV